jgi:tetratricopeptide (TPR) repeat protein
MAGFLALSEGLLMVGSGCECRATVSHPFGSWKLIDHMGLIDAAYLQDIEGMRLSDLDGTCVFLLSVPSAVDTVTVPVKLFRLPAVSALLIRRGEFGEGSARLRAALDTCERTGWTICYPEFLGALAEGLAGLGQFAEAIATIDRATSCADRGGERYFVAELLRNKGELLLRAADEESISHAEHCFSQALEVAREQGAQSWELRSALSFARLRVRQDRQDDARQLLDPVYCRFTEGFETPDLRSARTVLHSLPSRPPA